MKTIIVW